MAAVIADGGSAPALVYDSFQGLGVVVHGTDETVVAMFFNGCAEVKLVRGAQVAGTSQFEFYPMVKH